jgi:hypothetical protein
VLVALLGIGTISTATAVESRSHPNALAVTLLPDGRWCGRQVQFRMTVRNVADSTVWLSLPQPSLGPIAWMSYSFDWVQSSTEGDILIGETAVGIGCGGDRLAFIRSSEATKLLPGKSLTWKVRLTPRSLRSGAVDIKVWAEIDTTRNLRSDILEEFELGATIPLVLIRDAGCFEARRRLTSR